MSFCCALLPPLRPPFAPHGCSVLVTEKARRRNASKALRGSVVVPCAISQSPYLTDISAAHQRRLTHHPASQATRDSTGKLTTVNILARLSHLSTRLRLSRRYSDWRLFGPRVPSACGGFGLLCSLSAVSTVLRRRDVSRRLHTHGHMPCRWCPSFSTLGVAL